MNLTCSAVSVFERIVDLRFQIYLRFQGILTMQVSSSVFDAVENVTRTV